MHPSCQQVCNTTEKNIICCTCNPKTEPGLCRGKHLTSYSTSNRTVRPIKLKNHIPAALQVHFTQEKNTRGVAGLTLLESFWSLEALRGSGGLLLLQSLPQVIFSTSLFTAQHQ